MPSSFRRFQPLCTLHSFSLQPCSLQRPHDGCLASLGFELRGSEQQPFSLPRKTTARSRDPHWSGHQLLVPIGIQLTHKATCPARQGSLPRSTASRDTHRHSLRNEFLQSRHHRAHELPRRESHELACQAQEQSPLKAEAFLQHLKALQPRDKRLQEFIREPTKKLPFLPIKSTTRIETTSEGPRASDVSPFQSAKAAKVKSSPQRSPKLKIIKSIRGKASESFSAQLGESGN